MSNKKSLKLVDIVRREDFRRELSRAAKLSHEVQGEAHFLVYLTEDNHVKINEAIPGFKKLSLFGKLTPQKELTDDCYDWECPDHSNPNSKHKPNKGGYIELYSCALIDIHFHPPESIIIPSRGDFGSLNRAKRQNDNIVEICTNYGDPLEYINPLHIIGNIIGNDPNSYELFIYQEKKRKPSIFDDFFNLFAEKLNEKSGEEFSPEFYHLCGYGLNFTNAAEFCHFLNSLGCHQSELFNVTGQDYSDLDRISVFQKNLVKVKSL